MLNNPKLYEINIRVWIKRFGPTAKISDIPKDYWLRLKGKGIDFVRLMGIWKTCRANIDSTCFTPELVKQYNAALKDWTKNDVIGSPHAIDEYRVNPDLGTEEDVIQLKKILNEIGIALILDFVPNHFGSTSEILKNHPEIFLTVSEEIYRAEPHTYFTVPEHPGLYFAHGRDPFFPAWSDTAQVNYFNPSARDFMAGTLQRISNFCDGVRCSMAMLILNNIFGNTWRGAADPDKYPENSEEFWTMAIKDIKMFNPGFLFVAETYWNLEKTMQGLGFDYTSDKVLYDKLKNNSASEIKGHLTADLTMQQKSVRFIEKSEEERAIKTFGHDKSMAAAVITATIPGLMLYQDGQWEGKNNKIPLQLGREGKSQPHPKIVKFYEKLLKITGDRVFKDGIWNLLACNKAWDDNNTNVNMLSWRWKLGIRNTVVVVNYSDINSQCRLKFDVNIGDDRILLNDLMGDKIYVRAIDEFLEKGLFIDLPSYQSHVFVFDEDNEGGGSYF